MLNRLSFCRVLRFTFLLVATACGDNHRVAPDAGIPDAPPDAGPACRLDLAADALAAGSWDPRFTTPGFGSHYGVAPMVFELARDVDGSILAAGEFNHMGSEHVAPLMRRENGVWKAARANWEIPPPGAGFSSIAIAPDGTLALATYDDFADRTGEIWLDDGSGLRKIGEFEGLIRRLLWFDGELWAAGYFEMQSGASTIAGLAVWNQATWTEPPGGAMNGFAFELVHDGSELLVGGEFDLVGGTAALNVAAYNGTSWRALSFPNAKVQALARGPGGELYAGGSFGDMGNTTGGIARWTGTLWVKAAGGLGNRFIAGVVGDLALHDGSLFVSGCFRTAGGPEDDPAAVVSRNVVRYDGSTWHSLDDDTSTVLTSWFEQVACGDEGLPAAWNMSRQSLFSAGNELFLSGSFAGTAGVHSHALVAWDGVAWHAQGGAGGLGFAGSLDKIAIAPQSCEAWGLGTFSHVAGVPTNARVVRFNGTAWTPIEGPLARKDLCPGFAMSPEGEVTVACIVAPDDGEPVGRVFRGVGSQLEQVGGDLPTILALEYGADGTLWVAGNQGETGFVGKLQNGSITMIEAGFDAPVTELEPIAANQVVAAGYFSKVGALDAARIARWDGAAWHALGAGLPGPAAALAHDGQTVYASTYDEGAGSYLLGMFDGTTWLDLASPTSGITPQPYFNFNAIEVIDGAVIAVGTAILDDLSARHALVYRNGRFTGLGGGMESVILDGLAVAHDSVWVAGSIVEAGSPGTGTPSVGVARYVIAR